MNDQELPLHGIRVLDLTRLLPGAWCTQMLTDLGAEVIKVEQPGTGDYWRWVEPHVRTQGYAFLALNRGKKSIAIDLKDAAGKEALLALCATADVLLEGFRPGVMARLGLGPDELTRRFPRLVYCALTGFGQDGPDAQLAAHDLNYLGLTGVLHYVNGSRTRLRTTALPVGDIGGGAQMALTGILAALLQRGRTNRGRVVDISIADGLLSWVGFMSSRWNAEGGKRTPVPFDEPFDKPFYTVYETQDGGHMVVGAYEAKFWQKVCEVLELPEWTERQWASGEEEERLRAALAAKFKTKTREEWTRIFSEHEACVTPVLTLDEATRSPQAKARGMTIEVEDPVEGTLQHVACPIRFDGVAHSSLDPCPRLGEHTDELLASAGHATQQSAGRGLYFEDLREGDCFDSAETAIDEASIVAFAKAWDPQPFHLDKAFAERSLFGGLSASGLQTVLLSYKLYVDLGLFEGTALAGLGIGNVLFKAPLRPADRIRVRAVIASARRSGKPGRAVVQVALHTFNQTGEEIASLELNMLLACRSES